MKPFDLEKMYSAIGYVFRDGKILEQIFTHDSYANEHKVASYQRLEFLGDSVVNFAVAKELYSRYPDAHEGWLTKRRSLIVNNEGALANATDRMGIISYLRTSSGAAEETVASSQNVKADLFEAIAGGICLDGGIERAVQFVLTHLEEELNREYSDCEMSDYVSRLNEACDKLRIERPKYVVEPEGNGFSAVAFITGEEVGRGVFGNKKGAKQRAAKEALQRKFPR